MPRKPPAIKKPTGCPPKKIDWERVDQLLEYQCPITEIAADIGICVDTIYNRCPTDKGVSFSEYRQRGLEKGKIKLRQAQMELALSKDRGMLVHLGEHILDQTKKAQVEHSGNVTIQRGVFTPEPTFSSIADDKTADANPTTLSDTALELP